IEDASVPAHTRNDIHIPIYDSEPYEGWTESKADFAKYNPGDTYFPDILDGYGSDSWNPLTSFDPDKIIKSPDIFIDSGYLVDASTPPITGFNQGLAEYSHANFLSADTVFSDGNPNTISTIHGLADLGIADLGNVVFKEDREIGDETYSFFYVKNNTAQIDHFALCGIGWQIKQMEFMNGQTPETGILYTVDDPLVDEDYAKKLLPRAVGYSAGLLDYFFRGRLEVSALPVFAENAIYGIQMKIKNVTPTEEAMTMSDEDRLVLVFRYTPEGANADGSEDKFVTANAYRCIDGDCDADGNLDGIQYGDEATISFYLPEEEEDRIGMQIVKSAEDSVKCMLVFKGNLGQEESAVIGKYFTLGQDQVRFNEEWDNGLTGNHPWEHTTADQNPDNGTTSNVIVSTDTSSNSLIKNNVRDAGSSQGRINETFVDFNDVITPYTNLQFKIDDLSITGSSTQHWQALVLNFNEGRFLQLTRSGQGIVMNDTTVSYSFYLGAKTGLNIFEMFQNADISIPNPFYIESISFIQQLFEESQPTTTKTSQHMEVDYIRLIEEKQEE
ncbi:MAG: hypothetical protein KKH68_14485, partial [Proteobacteria bacterium]|nr:hypothetical protein [Pseudomonadota bacterium]